MPVADRFGGASARQATASRLKLSATPSSEWEREWNSRGIPCFPSAMEMFRLFRIRRERTRSRRGGRHRETDHEVRRAGCGDGQAPRGRVGSGPFPRPVRSRPGRNPSPGPAVAPPPGGARLARPAGGTARLLSRLPRRRGRRAVLTSLVDLRAGEVTNDARPRGQRGHGTPSLAPRPGPLPAHAVTAAARASALAGRTARWRARPRGSEGG